MTFPRFEKSCKDAFVKDALVAATSSLTILFRIHEESQGYQQVLIENNMLVVQCKAERIWTNVNDIANFKVETVIPSSGLPLDVQKNIRDHADDLKKNLQIIQAATGKEFTFEVNYEDVHGKIADNYKKRLGEILHDSYMKSIASMYEYVKRCVKSVLKNVSLLLKFVLRNSAGQISTVMIRFSAL